MTFRLTSRYKLHTTPELLGLLGLSSEAELQELLTNKIGYYREKLIKNKRWDESFKKVRQGWVPMGKMRRVQDRIAKLLLRDLHSQLPPRMMGGRPGYGIKKMAILHCDKDAVLKMDIEKCFDSITPEMVKVMLRKCLNNNCSAKNVSALAALLTVYNKLPQGAPGSTAVCNCVLHPVFISVENYCLAHGLDVSSWIDDFVISGPKDAVYSAKHTIGSLFRQHGFKTNRTKTDVYKRGEFGEVVGLTLGIRPTFNRLKRELLRKQWIQAANGDTSITIARLKGKAQFVKPQHPGFVKRLKNIQEQAERSRLGNKSNMVGK